jgi:D-sedoheptulose 7-phosphate isomerase
MMLKKMHPAPPPIEERVEPRPQYNLQQRINAYRQVVEWLQSHQHIPEMLAAIYIASFSRGGTVWFCGNGGSAADCQHLAAEYVNGMIVKGEASRPVDARALTVDTSVLTAIGNDRGYSQVFLKQLQAAVKEQDTVVFHSTSGQSENQVVAAEWLKLFKPRVATVALLGARSPCSLSRLATLVRAPIYVETTDQQATQLGHMMLQHLVVEVVECSSQHNWRGQKTPIVTCIDPHESYGA